MLQNLVNITMILHADSTCKFITISEPLESTPGTKRPRIRNHELIYSQSSILGHTQELQIEKWTFDGIPVFSSTCYIPTSLYTSESEPGIV